MIKEPCEVELLEEQQYALYKKRALEANSKDLEDEAYKRGFDAGYQYALMHNHIN